VTEAVELVTHYAFSTLHLRRVYAYVFPFNGGSQRVLEKAGYVREGLLRKNVNKKGKILDEIVYAKIRSR
jgi:ribosomal-protein-alanine N-acetyltransferase